MTDGNDFLRNELRITCADAVELVTEFLEDALNERDRDDFETHLSLCEACKVFVDQIRQTVTLTSQSRDTSVALEPANMADLLDLLDQQAARPAE